MDRDWLAAQAPDLIFAQDTCAVCSAHASSVLAPGLAEQARSQGAVPSCQASAVSAAGAGKPHTVRGVAGGPGKGQAESHQDGGAAAVEQQARQVGHENGGGVQPAQCSSCAYTVVVMTPRTVRHDTCRIFTAASFCLDAIHSHALPRVML